MCRDNTHGGRRCPHDTSFARRIRRHRAAIVAKHADLSYGAPAGFITPRPRPPVAKAPAPQAVTLPSLPPSVTNVRALREDVQTLERDHLAIIADPFSVSHAEPYMIDGVAYADSVQALAAIDNMMEAKILAAGDMVVALAVAADGVSETAVQTHISARLSHIDAALDRLARQDISADEHAQLQVIESALDGLTAKLNEITAQQDIEIAADLGFGVSDGKGLPAPDDARERATATELTLRTQIADLTQQRNVLMYADAVAAAALKTELAQLLDASGEQQPSEVQAILRQHAAAYGQVLRQARTFGGIRQQVHDASDPQAQATLQRALSQYPTDWVAQSNAGGTMIVIRHQGRAYYAHRNTIVSKADVLGDEEHVSELAVTDQDPGFGGVGYSIALHEYAHRVEDTGPRLLARMENHYLLRRATHDGVLERQQRIVPHLPEYAYVDDFPSAYMGRVYPNRRNREIFSMGMEAIFAGTKGGFVGVGGSRPDPETKRFVLGLLATA